MRPLKILHLLIVIALCCSSFTSYGATRTLDEINAEQQKKKEEEEKKAAEEAKKKEADKVAKEKKKAEEAKKAEEKKKAIKEEEEKKRKAAETASQKENSSLKTQTKAKIYTLTEEVIGIPKQFTIPKIDNAALMNADPKAVELFEVISKKEKDKSVIKNPAALLKIWYRLGEIRENNPFSDVVQERISEWKSVIAILDKHQENLDKISKLMFTNLVPVEQKVSIVSQHIDEFGLIFGIDEILNIAKNTPAAAEIAKNEDFRKKIKTILIARCEKKSGKDCFSNGKYFAASEDEKNAYFAKACELKYQPGCEETKKIKAAAEAEKARIAAEEKRKAEEEKRKIEEEKRKAEEEKNRQIKKELNQAGRKKRLTIATSTFVSGIVVSVLGGISFHGMNKAENDRKKYYKEYLLSEYGPKTDNLRSKSENADKKRKTFMALGIIGVGAGVALIATGITFYSIDFDGEKEVKKKYNISIGASPADGTLQLALKW